MLPKEIMSWLREEDGARLEKLWSHADDTRQNFVGDAVHLRGIIEISNYCVRRCLYCGINYTNKQVSRYIMDSDE